MNYYQKKIKKVPNTYYYDANARPNLRNANYQVRGDPPIGNIDTGPWNQTTIEPDKMRRHLKLVLEQRR